MTFKHEPKEPDFKFNLGDRLKDDLTGFEGICVYRTQWITNCNVYGIKPDSLDKDGEPRKSSQFDEPHISVVQEKVAVVDNDTGGPTDSPSVLNRV